MHLPAAIGVLIARLIYPSLGIMDYGGRIANLLFFAFAFYFLIKKNKYAKWSMILLFVIGGIQKKYLVQAMMCLVFSFLLLL